MKRFYFCGLFAPVIFILMVIIGTAMWGQGYSHIDHAISELTMPIAPNQWITQPLFITYNILLITFGIGFFAWSKNEFIKASAILIVACGLAGLLMFPFPMDPIGMPATLIGVIHFVLGAIAAVTIILAIFLAGFGFGRIKKLFRLKKLSIRFGSAIFFFVALAEIIPIVYPYFFGILERIAAGLSMYWLFFVANAIGRFENKKMTKA